MYATELKLEGQYRQCHSDILAHSEEIAFYNGHEWEKMKMEKRFTTLLKHVKAILHKRMLMGIFDSMLVKYGATMSGYTIVALPVFGPNRHEYLKSVGNDSSKITKDYIRNTSLLINLAKAIGRFIISYKEIQQLAGYTHLIDEMENVLRDLKNDKYERPIVPNAYGNFTDSKKTTRGDFKISDQEIKFDKVPIVTPNGDLLVPALDFTIARGTHVMIAGPNGCGKSSLFRIIANMWPHFDGTVTMPNYGDIMYVPQKAYMPPGTLRDQVIYPDTKEEMLRKGWSDEKLNELFKKCFLEKIPPREGGWDAVNDFYDVFSGGEKQRCSMARLIYHKPKFAVLDDCTSATSIESEGPIYEFVKEQGITMLTVSHKPILWKYHDLMLHFSEETGFKVLKMEDVMKDPKFQEEIRKGEKNQKAAVQEAED